MGLAGVASQVSSVISWLESGSDAYTWKTAADLIAGAMDDAQGMAQPLRGRDKGFENRPPQPSPVAREVRHAWPHLQSLQSALELHDRENAVKHGRKAVAALEGQPEEV